eukprot:g21916.t1
MHAFESHGVSMTADEVRGPMGLHKKDHIRALFQLESVGRQWQAAHDRAWNEDDVSAIYDAFMPVQIQKAQEFSQLIPGARECFDALKERGILVGTSTGYPRSVADPIIAAAAEQGYRPDASMCADEVPQGRPAPWMIFRNMEMLGVYPPAAVLKVGDTAPDIEAGLNAGARTVGITQTGSEVGLTAEEFDTLDPSAQEEKVRVAETRLKKAGADFVIRRHREHPSMDDDIPYLLLTPGPLTTTRTVREAMLRDYSTWDIDYNSLVNSIRSRLVNLAAEQADDFTAVLMQGSGTFGVEATVGSVIPDDGCLLVVNNGAYGKRIRTIAERLNIATIDAKFPETEPAGVDMVDRLLNENPQVTHVAIVHCETTTGMRNPAAEIGSCAHRHGKIVILDAMSSFGGMQMSMESMSADFLISSANKCIQGVPGFAFVIARRTELAGCEGRARTHVSEKNVIIVGGGIWGMSTAFHLAKRGVEGVCVLERNAEAANETTPRAAGLVGQIRSSPTMCQAIRYALDLFEGFQEDTGHDPGLHRVGSLLVALHDERMGAFKRQAQAASESGVKMESVSHDEIKRLAPAIDVSRVVGGYFVTGDGYLDPRRCALAYAAAATDLGVETRYSTNVIGFIIEDGRVKGVETETGTFSAERVVVTAGPWTRLLAEPTGFDMPLQTIRHQRARTAPVDGIPGHHPVVRVHDVSCYVRPEQGGYLYGFFEPNPTVIDPAGLHTADIPVPEATMAEARRRLKDVFPILNELNVVENHQGITTFAPDGQYLIGPVPEADGMYVASGCAALGIAGSAAVGSWLAESVETGKLPDALNDFNLHRFGEAAENRAWVEQAGAEFYGNYYALTPGRPNNT